MDTFYAVLVNSKTFFKKVLLIDKQCDVNMNFVRSAFYRTGYENRIKILIELKYNLLKFYKNHETRC